MELIDIKSNLNVPALMLKVTLSLVFHRSEFYDTQLEVKLR